MGILDKVKNLLSQNADKVETVINKAGEFVDEQTQGNYSDAIPTSCMTRPATSSA